MVAQGRAVEFDSAMAGLVRAPSAGGVIVGSRYTLAVLAGLTAVAHGHGYVLAVLAPEIAGALGAGATALAWVMFVRVAALLAGAGVASVARPGLLAVIGAAAWTGASLLGAAGAGVWVVVVAAALYGAGSSTVLTAHGPLLRDAYGAGSAAMEQHRNAGRIGNVAVAALPGLVFGLTGSWRAAFIAAGVVAVPWLVAALPLAARRTGRAGVGDPALTAVTALPGGRPLVRAMAVLAVVEIPMYPYLFVVLHQRWGVGAPGRGVLAALLEAISVVVSVLLIRRHRQVLAVAPERLLARLAAALVVGAAAVVAVVSAPHLGVALAGLVLMGAVLTPVIPLLWLGPVAILGLEPRRRRRELAGVLIAGAAVLVVAGAAERMAGPAASLIVLVPVLLAPAAAAVQLGSTVSSDRRSSAGSGDSVRASESSRIASA